MNAEIAAKLAAVANRCQIGQGMREAFESQFGAGSYDKLAGMIYDELRGNEAAELAAQRRSAGAAKVAA